jgi:hypothetical protein
MVLVVDMVPAAVDKVVVHALISSSPLRAVVWASPAEETGGRNCIQST